MLKRLIVLLNTQSAFLHRARPFTTAVPFAATCVSRRKMSYIDGSNSGGGGAKPAPLVMDDFAIRQFNNPEYTGTGITFPVDEFERTVNNFYTSEDQLRAGYAPFCKHLFVPNFAGVKCGYVEKTEENKHLIESGYESRKKEELAVLVEFIPQSKLPTPQASHLDIILYSREQITKENLAMGLTPPATDAPWGIISVKGQLCDFETPMQPITVMRNGLGVKYGGSGIDIDEDKYAESVAFWSKHVAIK